MKYTNQILIILGILFVSCSGADNTPDYLESKESIVSVHRDSSENYSDSIDSIYLDSEPPFKFPCDFDFDYLEDIKVSDSRSEQIVCGKGWDSRLHSCTWVYGEHIYNSRPSDTSISDYRIHIVDLDSTEIIKDKRFLKNDIFQNHIIATTVIRNDTNMFTIWDPNKTGKYKKPRQWTE